MTDKDAYWNRQRARLAKLADRITAAAGRKVVLSLRRRGVPVHDGALGPTYDARARRPPASEGRPPMRHRHHVFLAAPGVGLLHGTFSIDRTRAAVLLSDRIANGEAFPGEFVVRVPTRAVPDRLLWGFR